MWLISGVGTAFQRGIMGFFDRFKSISIDDYIAGAAESGAVLIDVREPHEYQQGHIPGAVNIPLGSIGDAASSIHDKNALLYAYCARGMRSKRAVSELMAMGFKSAMSIGGINSYHGPVEM